MASENPEKQFGFVAVRKGFVTKDQLYEALKIQLDEILREKERRCLGSILHALGYITILQINEVLETMHSPVG